VDKPGRALLVGLGGGTLPRFLQRHFPEVEVDAVDIDPVVVEVAQKLFAVRETDHLHLYVDDGRAFIEKTQRPYDVIFLDAYNAKEIPYALATKEFLTSVRRALAPTGVVVANIWERLANPLHDSMVLTYQSVFGWVRIVAVRGEGNEILLAMPGSNAPQETPLIERGAALSRDRGLHVDLGKMIAAGIHDVGNVSQSEVLLDRKN
jgi:spermidine synthase